MAGGVPDRPRRRRGPRPPGLRRDLPQGCRPRSRCRPRAPPLLLRLKEELLLEVVTVTERQMVANWKAVVRGGRRSPRAHRDRPRPRRSALRRTTRVLPPPPRPVHGQPEQPRAPGPVRHASHPSRRRDRDRAPAGARPPSRVLAGLAPRARQRDPQRHRRDRTLRAGRPASRAAPFHALKVLLLSLVVTAYVTAGQEPPIARLGEMLSRHP